ncbi:hypothetical protein HALLA_15615 [Halostagnicola larsenii XH-48]|uniref:DUF7115 domain-containing protein n=1 Tax=Halostagnicola larsenii XH-48 TaxID=797299 RepID=W0JN42_9EURY|nr:hypothetical protein [Halostagnicola larsenii]AHG00014.1 hypothetical protein HALLA_15615 [Halostagnicola larsenii XH-48]
MSVPGIVQSTLDGEEIVTRVSLGGDDELFITPTDSIIYRADGLLSDESVEEFPHDADRLTISEGRRKTRFTLEYALDGTRDFTIPSGSTDTVLTPLVAGVLNGNGISDPDEAVIQTYRFSELTLIVTSDRLVKHIGEAVWDEDFEQYHFDDVTNLSFEDGSVATQIVLEVDGRPKRIKAPNDEAADLRERLERALFAYHGVDTLAQLNNAVGREQEPEPSEDPVTAFGEGVDPLDANPPTPEELDRQSTEQQATESNENAASSVDSNMEPDQDAASEAVVDQESEPRQVDPLAAHSSQDESSKRSSTESTDESAVPETTEPDVTADGQTEGSIEDIDDGSPSPSFGESGFTAATAGTDPELLERLDDLEETVEKQTVLLEEQQRTIEQLITELRQGR